MRDPVLFRPVRPTNNAIITRTTSGKFERCVTGTVTSYYIYLFIDYVYIYTYYTCIFMRILSVATPILFNQDNIQVW